MRITRIDVYPVEGRPEFRREVDSMSWDDIVALVRGVDSLNTYALTIAGAGLTEVQVDVNEGRYVISGCFEEHVPVGYILSSGAPSEEMTEVCICGDGVEVPASCLVTEAEALKAIKWFYENGTASPRFVQWG